MGPTTAKVQWEKAKDKYKYRCCEIAGVGASASISAKLYNMHAVPVLGYIAQFQEPPPTLPDQERHCLHKVLHLPPNSLGKAEILSLPLLGGVMLSSVEVMCAASLFRAGFSSFVWQDWFQTSKLWRLSPLNASPMLFGLRAFFNRKDGTIMR